TRSRGARPCAAAHLRTSLIAASLASAPELHSKARSAKRLATRGSSARRSGGSLKSTLLVCHSLPACSTKAACRSGSLWPRLQTAMPAAKSTYSRPSLSHSRAPWPRASTRARCRYTGRKWRWPRSIREAVSPAAGVVAFMAVEYPWKKAGTGPVGHYPPRPAMPPRRRRTGAGLAYHRAAAQRRLRSQRPTAMSRIETLAARAGSRPDPASGALSPPLQLATTFEHTPDGQLPQGFLYQRYDNPTQQETEQVLAALEGAKRALLFPTGMAAGATALQALPPGSHVLLCDDSYFSFRVLAAQQFPRWGLECTIVDFTDLDAVRAALRPNTALLW